MEPYISLLINMLWAGVVCAGLFVAYDFLHLKSKTIREMRTGLGEHSSAIAKTYTELLALNTQVDSLQKDLSSLKAAPNKRANY